VAVASNLLIQLGIQWKPLFIEICHIVTLMTYWASKTLFATPQDLFAFSPTRTHCNCAIVPCETSCVVVVVVVLIIINKVEIGVTLSH